MVWLFSHIQLEPIFEFFFFNDTATTEIYTLSLHDALPICAGIDEDGLAHLGLLRRSALGFPGAQAGEEDRVGGLRIVTGDGKIVFILGGRSLGVAAAHFVAPVERCGGDGVRRIRRSETAHA